MAEDGEWTPEQWAEALPPSATASLVASRVLARMRKRPEADRLADLAIRQAEAPTPPGYDPAEHRAAGAEALAYRGRWTDAAEQYRLAIDQAEDDATRRMWWLNLAEVAQRLGDDSSRARAIEAAKAPDSADEITRRALQYQQSLPGPGLVGPPTLSPRPSTDSAPIRASPPNRSEEPSDGDRRDLRRSERPRPPASRPAAGPVRRPGTTRTRAPR